MSRPDAPGREAILFATLRSAGQHQRVRRVRSALRALVTVAIVLAALVDALPLVLLGGLALFVVDSTCQAVEGLLAVTPEQMAALRGRR